MMKSVLKVGLGLLGIAAFGAGAMKSYEFAKDAFGDIAQETSNNCDCHYDDEDEDQECDNNCIEVIFGEKDIE
jgi:hypothetical protein